MQERSLFKIKAGLVLCLLMSLALLVRAQTLQFSLPFNDGPGTTTASSGGAISVTLNTVYSNNAANNSFPLGSYVPVDLHAGANSFLSGGQALDFTKVEASAVAYPAPNAVAYTTNNPNLGLGAVSQCTASFWFKYNTGNSGVGRLFFLGTNGIIDSTPGFSSIGIQQQNLNQLQVEMNQNGSTLAAQNVTFSPLVNGEIPLGQWEFVTLVYDASINNGVYSLYTGDYAHAPTLVASNIVVNKGPLNLGTSGTLIMGNNLAFNRPFPGKIANFQFYTGAGNAAWVSNLWAATVPVPYIVVSPYAGADIGSKATLTVTVPGNFTATSNYVVSLNSDNSSVVASTNVTIYQYVSSQQISLPILGQGMAHVTVSGPGLGSSVAQVSGLNESGLVNQWLADTYVSGQNWTDSVSQVVATINSSSQASSVPGIFGAHSGVIESNYNASVSKNNNASGTGFLIPAGTSFGGAQNAGTVTNWTVGVVFKPIAAGATGGGYYNASALLGWDIGGAGQQDWGISWGNNDGSQAGLEMEAGVGGNGSGDAPLWEPASVPNSGLNQVHSAVLQVDATTSRDVLFVDGKMVSSAYLAAYHINTNNDFPILQGIYANAFPGYIAEIRFYTNALVDAGGLSSYLQNSYSGLLPITISAAPKAADVGSNVTVSVTIPSIASASGAFSVTLTSGNTSVVVSTNVTIAQGATNISVDLPVLGVGLANVTASGVNLSSAATAVYGLAPRVLSESFLATSLSGLNDGDQVGEWDGSIRSTPAYAGAAAPTYHANATRAGTPAVQFVKGNQTSMGILAGTDPVADLTNFSIVCVFKADDVGNTGANWWDDAGIADHEMPGTVNDWGLEFDGNGRFVWGTGNPNDTMINTNYNSVVDPLFHVVVTTYDFLNGTKTMTVDDRSTITVTNVASGMRLSDTTRLGVNLYGAYSSGQIAELDFYNGALNNSEVTNLIASLKSTYDLIWPDQSLISLSASPLAVEVGQNSAITVSIPEGFNSSSPVTVTLTSDAPSVATIGGGSTLNVIFGAGATNVQTVQAQMLSLGAANITSSSAGLTGSTVTLTGLAAPTAVEVFKASDLSSQYPGIADGDAVSGWTGEILSTPVVAGTVAPFFRTNGPNGSPEVQFISASNTLMTIDPASDPVNGLTNFSLVAVLKVDNEALTPSGPNWWDMAGILDDEEFGTPADWGLEISSAGEPMFGTGSANTQVSQTGYNVVGASYHVIVASYDSINGVSSIRTDNEAPVVQTGAIGLPRIAGTRTLNIGANQYGDYLGGSIVELRIYSGAFSSSEATNMIGSLKSTYNLTFPDDVVPSYSLAITNESPGALLISWPTAATTRGYVLQTSTNLTSGWTNSVLPVGANGGNSTVTDTPTNTATFYRLYHP